MATPEELQALVDRQAIYDGYMRYFRGVDRCDEELMRSTYFEDAVAFSTSAWKFVKEFIPSNREETTFTFHALANLTVDFDGNKAHSEAYFLCYVGRNDNGREVVDTFCGRYVDQWERRNSEWKIVHRDVSPEWSAGAAFIPGGFPTPESEQGTFTSPARDRSDISYQR
jgi:SnoaL-like domain